MVSQPPLGLEAPLEQPRLRQVVDDQAQLATQMTEWADQHRVLPEQMAQWAQQHQDLSAHLAKVAEPLLDQSQHLAALNHQFAEGLKVSSRGSLVGR
jgi:hypothetical protein